MPRIPRDPLPDSTLALRLDPYRYIAKRCRAHRSDLFEARLMLQRTLCMSGPDAAALFYDRNRFTRLFAAPPWLSRTLFGINGVQSQDGASHLSRKAIFMSLVTPERVGDLVRLAEDGWCREVARWATMERVTLYEAVAPLLVRAVCEWSGIPLAPHEVGRRTNDIVPLFDRAGGAGPQHFEARDARQRAEAWLASLVEDVREGRHRPPPFTAIARIAFHRDPWGQPLNARIAAVELLNVLRPTVAVSVFITFAAHALHRHPRHRRRIAAGDAAFLHAFVQEVRRFYPFFPSVAARVRHDFEWRGYRFPQGRRAILDLYGTDHDARAWRDPDDFVPERFLGWRQDPFTLIPQGGGDPSLGHRCPGEPIAIELTKLATWMLVNAMRYDVPPQDLAIDMRRVPALPRSGFVIANVRPADAPESDVPMQETREEVTVERELAESRGSSVERSP